MKHKFIISILLLIISFNLHAEDFFSVDGIYYLVKSNSSVSVTHKKGGCYSGTLDIPSTVNHNGKVYRVEEINNLALNGCKDLHVIRLPEYIENVYIDGYHCPNLERIVVDENNQYFKSIDGVLFSKDETALVCYPAAKEDREYTIPNGVKKTKSEYYSAFEGVQFLERINFPSSFEVLECELFAKSILEYNIDKDNPYFKSIDGIIFSKDQSVLLKYPVGKEDYTYKVPSYVKKIRSRAFTNSENLRRVVLPNSVDSIEGWAFAACENLYSLNIPNTIKYIESSAFFLSNIDYFSITGNSRYFTEDGVLFEKEGEDTTLLVYPSGKSSRSYTLPDYVKTIAEQAFRGAQWLENLTLNKQVKSCGTIIGESAIKNIFGLTCKTM